MKIVQLDRFTVLSYFNQFNTQSTEYKYIMGDCVPYYDQHEYWDTNPPYALVDQYNNIYCICFCTTNEHNGLTYVDIKRILTPDIHKRKGYAKRLLDAICSTCSDNDVKYIRMFCSPEAKEFYKTLGYKFHGKCSHGYEFVFQPLVEFDRSEEVKTKELKFIKEQINQYSGVLYDAEKSSISTC